MITHSFYSIKAKAEKREVGEPMTIVTNTYTYFQVKS